MLLFYFVFSVFSDDEAGPRKARIVSKLLKKMHLSSAAMILSFMSKLRILKNSTTEKKI